MDPAWIAGTAAVISSGAAIWAVTNGNRTLKRSDRDSQARSRPMVAAELRDEPYATATQLLVIKNYGPTVARNVKVTFDPPLGDPAPEKAHESMAPFLKRRYAKPIPSLVPGQELDNIYFDGECAGAGGWKNREPHPDQVRVTVELDAPDGARYIDHFDLDVNLIRDRTMVTSSRHPEERLKRAVKALEDINKTLIRVAGAAPTARRAQEAAEQNAALIERMLGPSSEGEDDKHADGR